MFVRRILVALAALLLATAAHAASVAERSPFVQGLWWDPARPGNGFEIFNTNAQVALIWFTYTEAGRPVWYTAHGSPDRIGKEAWPLLQHRWSGSRSGTPTVVGSVRLNVRHAQSAEIAWQLGNGSGTWPIEPMIHSGVVNEIDHTGAWFDPRNSGWGLSLTEQGDVLGGVLYTYDAAGAPTWAMGFERAHAGSVEFHAYSGACPSCAQRTAVPTPVGRLSFDMRAEAELGVRGSLGISVAAGLNVDGASIVQLGRPASTRPADRQLAHFDAASSLAQYLTAGMLNLSTPSSGGLFSAAPPATVFSTTNLQEAGVDEADLVKSDGTYVYTYAHDTNSGGVRLPVVRIAHVGADGEALQIRGAVSLQSGPTTPMEHAGLFLHAGQLVSVAGTRPLTPFASPWLDASAWLRGVTHVELLTTSNPDVPVTRWRAEIDGHFVASRRIGDRLYVVSRFVPFVSRFVYGATDAATVAANREVIENTPLSALLPKVRVNDAAAVAAVDVGAVHIPPQGSRKPAADMILVTAIDLAAPRIAQTLAIVGTAETVYVSSKALFVATSRYDAPAVAPVPLPGERGLFLTDVHQIRLDAGAMSIVGSASVEGILGYDPDKSAFRLSEHQGRLRAVTSSSTMWGGGTKNRLTILEPSTSAPGVLRTVSYLPNARRAESLGKPNEVLYGTRFVGDRLYAVTFKQIDPLYVVDLSDSSDPRIAGAVELPGFSDYLHPLQNGLLLGFGKDARPADVSGDGPFAWYQGLQLTLFDVANASLPREIQRVVIGKRGSDSALLKHHHAFSALMQPDGSGLIAIPGRIHDGPAAPYADDSTFYPWEHSGLLRFELRGTGPSDARLVQLPSLVTHRATQPYRYSEDAAGDTARSILFRNGTIYVGNGRFWRRDGAGNVFGPY